MSDKKQNMDTLEYGPVEMVLAAFEGSNPSAGVLDALAELNQSGTIRVIDLAFVSRADDGALAFVEIEESGVDVGGLELVAAGLTAEEDLLELSSQMEPGTSALLIVVELLWAKTLASRLFDANGFVVDSVRIPAPIVNIAVAEAEELAEALEELEELEEVEPREEGD